VAEAVAAALGVAEHPHQRLESVIAGRIGHGQALLILDNCEHLLAAVADFAAWLLSECPNVRVLATSRERLGISGERLVTIEPLPASDAVALFLDRARQVDPGFDAGPGLVAELCARLDGLPLAIELAAARASGLGAEGLFAAIGDHLRLLTGGRGPDQRHQSLRAVLEWSHDLLDDEARVLFRRLAVFAGSFDLDAATVITAGERPVAADVLGRLADQSLIVHERPAGRWRLLGTIRAFATDRLEASGERDEIQHRHLRWAAATATRLEAELGRARTGAWRSEFDATAGDLRAALSATASRHGAVNAHQFARSLGRLAFARRFLQEATGHFRRAAEFAPTAADAVQDLLSVADCTFVSTTSGPETFQLPLAAAQRADPAQHRNARAIALARAVATAGRYQVVRHPGPEVTPGQVRRCLDEASATGDHNDPVVAAALAIATAWSARHDLTAAQAAAAAARDTGDPVLTSAALDAVSYSQHRAGRLRQARRGHPATAGPVACDGPRRSTRPGGDRRHPHYGLHRRAPHRPPVHGAVGSQPPLGRRPARQHLLHHRQHADPRAHPVR
jgi:predicted ATPase